MNRLTFIVVLIVINQNIFSQQIRISKVIDSNLFELKDNTRIKLAGIDMPRLDNPDYLLRNTAKYAVVYSKKKLLGKPFRLRILNESEGVKLVYLITDYPFGDKNNNLSFLEQGFGKFTNNIDSSDAEKFIAAEEFARDENKGIWKVLNDDDASILDREYTEAEKNDPAITDSLEYLIRTTPKPQFSHIALELLVSPAVGFIIGIPTGLLSVAIFAGERGEWNEFDKALMGWYAGYLIGSSLCVYAISENTTKKVNLPALMIINALSGGLGIAISRWNDNHIQSENAWLFYAPLVLPIISSVVYANVIAPDKFPDQSISSRYQFNDKHLSAADLYNRSKLFEINLLRINL